MTLLRPVKPRASRTALIVASVPELTRRTCSTGPTRRTISSASSTSPGDRCAEGQSRARRALHRVDHCGVGVPENRRAPRADEIDIGVAVGVVEVRTLAANHEPRRAPDSSERAHRRVDSAGRHRLRAGEQLAGDVVVHATIMQCRTVTTRRHTVVLATESPAPFTAIASDAAGSPNISHRSMRVATSPEAAASRAVAIGACNSLPAMR